jgi:hypothetical protein
VSENRVLRSSIFGPKRDEITGVWRKLHNEKLHNLLFTKQYYSKEIKNGGMGGSWSTHGKR